MRTKLYVIVAIALLSVYSAHADELTDWIGVVQPIAQKNLLRNISYPGTARGCVIASPSRENPDYFYHWVRDAGITMDVVVRYFIEAKDSNEKVHLESTILDYINFSAQIQATPNLSGGAGEPKFNVDGTAYLKDWGRPQNDGPALRALSLIRLAGYWIAQGKKDWVEEKLYNSLNTSVVKYDLEYISHNWKNSSIELWEETRGQHFYTRLVQKRALEEGAGLAEYLGDRSAASWYRQQAAGITKALYSHWSESKKIIVETLNQESGPSKPSGLDSAVVLAVLHAGNENGDFSIADEKLASTVAKLEEAFQSIYPVNQKGFPAVAIGRYPEDKYDGYTTHGEGNPWLLITSGFAEYYYRLAKVLNKASEIRITPNNQAFFASLLGQKFQGNMTFKSGEPQFRDIIERLTRKGDDYLTRVKLHTDGDGAMAEQMNRHSGYQQGARDLTWSYGAFLSAINAKSR